MKNTEQTYKVGVYEKAFPEELTTLDALLIAKDSGYDFYEINIDRTEKRIDRVYNLQYQLELEKAIEKSGFQVGSLGLSALSTYTLGHPDHEIEQRALDIFRNTILFAVRFGIRIVQIPACDMPKFDVRTDDTRDRFFRNLKYATEFAGMNGVVLGMENMENDFMDSIKKCADAVAYINSPYLQLYPDAGNVTNAWKNDMEKIISDMELCRGKSLAFHLKEVQPDRYGGLFYGDGHVDFKTLAKKAYDLGIRRFGMEYWYTGNENWKQDLVTARKYCDFWINGEDK